MKQPQQEANWPVSWLGSYDHDCKEVFGDRSNLGYTLAYQQRYITTLELVKQVIPVGGTILDLGAAQGNFSLALAEAGYAVTWNDLRAELIDYIRLKYEYGNLKFAPGNIFELELEHPFDCVLLTEVIEHVAHPDALLARAASFIKPSGYIVISTPNGNYFRNKLPKFSDFDDPAVFEKVQFTPDVDGHIFLMHRDELFSLSKLAGLSLEKLYYLSNPLINGSLKLRKVQPYLPEKLLLFSQKLVRLVPVIERKLSVDMVALLKRPD